MARSLIQIPLIAMSAHGGIRILVAFANNAAEQGGKVRILVPRNRIGKVYKLHPAVEVRKIPIATGFKYLDYFLFLLVCPFYLRQGTLVANFFVTYFPVLAARLLFRRPFIYFVQDVESVYRGPFGWFLNMLCNFSYRSRWIVPASNFLARQLEELGARPLATVNIGISASFLDTPLMTEHKSYDLICFPRPEHRKGCDRLLRVLADYNERFGALSVLAVSQDGVLLDKFGALGCHTEKPKDDRALIECYDRSRVMLFTSYHDGFGLPPLEAMSRAVPPVVFQCGGPEAIYMADGENGFVLPSEKEDQASALIRLLLQDNSLRMSLGRQGRKTSEEFSLGRAMNDLLALIEKRGN